MIIFYINVTKFLTIYNIYDDIKFLYICNLVYFLLFIINNNSIFNINLFYWDVLKYERNSFI